MSEENEWSLSFNPMTDEDIDLVAFKEALSPYVLSVTRKSAHRYELVLDDELPDNPPMGEVLEKVIFMLGEIYPSGVVVGHLDNEPEY
ncbi:hypothetical protein [Rhizobium sp. BK176]|uniref:hypothetical protein n=1 Tax=Rhizobium sp. BK176 TaxID=2587071 RepID=UPI002168A37D|nr:hypothetical protein [Rhizobium sp. BK176]MCS4089029.1 hypothetical protein [Rhizobium sp. BK176]